MPPRLSLVVVNWNTRELLLTLLRRLPLDDAPWPAEILVVDNDSQDGSVAAVAAEFPAVTTLPQSKNGGFAFGVNRGLERATGEWILLFNTDADADWASLARFVEAAAADAETCNGAIYGPGITDELGAPQVSTWQRHLPRHYLPQALFLDRLFRRGTAPRAENDRPTAADVDCVSGCVFLIRRAVLTDVDGFDERFFMYFEEADFCERVRQAGYRVRWLPETTFVHVGGLSAEGAAVRTFLAFRESCLLYHAAWHGRLATEWVRLCLLLSATIRLVIWVGLALVGRGRRAGLYARAVGMLLRPGLVGRLCREPRATRLARVTDD
ncbi:MAG: glycosyltransferase [bacterium]|nr:glycosyltransferase [bacterium]